MLSNIMSGGLAKVGPKSGPLHIGSVRPNMTTKGKSHSEGEGCTHYGNLKHTCETCFNLHGYLEWWNELKAKKKHDTTVNATLVNVETQLSLITHGNYLAPISESTAFKQSINGGALLCLNHKDYHCWIVD